MEVLTRAPRPEAVLKSLAFAGLVALLCAAIAILGLRQRAIERYGAMPVFNKQYSSVGSLREKSGAVVVNRPGALKAEPLEPGDKLFPGDRVQTQEGARASLALTGGARLTLDENSLLQVPEPERHASRDGAVLQIDSGSFHLDSDALRGIETIRTPQASINLRTRDIALVRPAPGARPDLAYLQALIRNWFPDKESRAGQQALETLAPAAAACAAPRGHRCEKALDRAWRALTALRRERAGARVVLDVTIGKSGKENITVAGGAVSVKTQNRTLLVARGETLNLDDSVPTRRTMSAQALLTVAPRPEEKPPVPIPEPEIEPEEPYFEIESIQWQ